MNKLLVICGPTSTGKTSLALYLAKKYGGELVSADSRQVYKNMNIGTGKGLLKNFQFTIYNSQTGGYYETSGVKIWGYDLVDPKCQFSVAQYEKFANKIIEDIAARNKLPILVGGTGLYIKVVVDGILTASVRPDKRLRKSLQTRSVIELYEVLAQLDSIKAASLNSSDKKNPRRLIRAIEIALAIKTKEISAIEINKYDLLFIGLNCSKEALDKKIEERIKERISMGFADEIEKLIKLGVSWKHQSMTSLGYGHWHEYLDGEITKQEAIDFWEKEEKKYARRQITWFKKDKRISWFDISSSDYKERVEELVQKWYHNEKFEHKVSDFKRI